MRDGVSDDVVVVIADHCGTTARGAHDVIVAVEDVEVVDGDGASIVDAAGIGHWLAAAGLLGWKVNLAAVMFEQFERGRGDVGIELVDVAGNKERNSWHVRRFRMLG